MADMNAVMNPKYIMMIMVLLIIFFITFLIWDIVLSSQINGIYNRLEVLEKPVTGGNTAGRYY